MKKYKGCSIHGSEGDSDCKECWKKLKDLLRNADKEYGVYVSASEEDKKRLKWK